MTDFKLKERSPKGAPSSRNLGGLSKHDNTQSGSLPAFGTDPSVEESINLGDDDVGAMLNEKKEMEKALARDRVMSIRMNPDMHSLKNETTKERKKRHQDYLKWTLESKNNQMKRKLLGLVDSIHVFENEKNVDHISVISDEMKVWHQKCFEPVNYEVQVVDKMQKMDKEAAKLNNHKE